MPIDLMSGFLLLATIIICIIVYLVIVNILKFILSFRFLSSIIKDFKRASRKFTAGKEYKSWQPWKYG